MKQKLTGDQGKVVAYFANIWERRSSSSWQRDKNLSYCSETHEVIPQILPNDNIISSYCEIETEFTLKKKLPCVWPPSIMPVALTLLSGLKKKAV